MPSAGFCIAPYCLIPLSSDESLWEWDIVTNTLYLSHGALKSLNLSSCPRKMEDYYALMPPDAVIELKRMREGALSGKTGSDVECSYLCNGFWTKEYMLVLSRNSGGRATRVMGRLATLSTFQEHTVFSYGKGSFPETGVWIFHNDTGKIWLDKNCLAMLGNDGAGSNPIEYESALLDIHPSERQALQRHYNLFCNGTLLGDSITDIVRIKMANGEFTPIIVRASVMERDAEGRAVFLAGIMSQIETEESGSNFLANGNKLFHTLNSMGSGQWNWDTKADTIYFCPRYLAILGYAQGEGQFFTQNWRGQIHPDDLDKVMRAQQAAISSQDNGDTYECTYRMRRADGGWAWIFDRGCVIWRDTEGRAGHMIGSITNITAAQAERDKLEELVRHDTLTGLRSRSFCNLEFEHIEQNGIRPVSIISVDITGLKMINDNLGHAVGDELLTKAASLLRGALRASDCIGRIGGDELIVILPNCRNSKGQKLLRKIETCFEEYNSVQGRMPVFAACGLASGETVEEKLSAVIARADEAMYQNKKNHRKMAYERIRAWIKTCTGKEVIEDDRLGEV